MCLTRFFFTLILSLLFSSAGAVVSNFQLETSPQQQLSVQTQAQQHHCDHCPDCEQMTGHNCISDAPCLHLTCTPFHANLPLPFHAIGIKTTLKAQNVLPPCQSNYVNPHYPPLTPPPNT